MKLDYYLFAAANNRSCIAVSLLGEYEKIYTSFQSEFCSPTRTMCIFRRIREKFFQILFINFIQLIWDSLCEDQEIALLVALHINMPLIHLCSLGGGLLV